MKPPPRIPKSFVPSGLVRVQLLVSPRSIDIPGEAEPGSGFVAPRVQLDRGSQTS